MGWPFLLLLQTVATASPRDLSDLLRPILDRAHIPALGAALVTSNGVQAIGAVGRRSWAEVVPVTINDKWHIGSCTKAITATLVARLIDRGVLRWTTTVGDVFAHAVPSVDSSWHAIPIEWLLTHRSGMARNFPQERWERIVRNGGPLVEQRRRLVAETVVAPPSNPPNTATIYSNAGVIVAGAMLEALTGSSWEDLVRREIFSPLGMTESGFGAPGAAGSLDQPLGHTKGTDGWKPIPVGPGADNPPATGPAGTIHVTLADWGRFVAAHLRGEQGDTSYLSESAWRQVHSKRQADWEYTPGWIFTERPWSGGVLLRHLGSNQLWVAEAFLALRKDLAVLIVTNLGDDAAEKPFAEALAALVAEPRAHSPAKP